MGGITTALGSVGKGFRISLAIPDRPILMVANTWSAISQLQISEIKYIRLGFKEYDFNLKISN